MKSLKLNKINKNQLNAEQMKGISGGRTDCVCGCAYANQGGSSINANGLANWDNCLRSPGGGVVFIACEKEVVVGE